MTVREMIESLRVNTNVNLREDNNHVIAFDSYDYEGVKDELLDKQVYDWGVLNRGDIFINFKSEVENG